MNGLYMLQGSTIVGVATISSSIDPDSDNTYLGHMSEVGMSILSKQGFCMVRKLGSWTFVNIVSLVSSVGSSSK